MSDPQIRTWGDPFGWWHATVIVPTKDDAASVLEMARDAIAEEIRQRGNGAPTEAFLASDRYVVEYVVRGEKTPEGFRYEFAEYAPDRGAVEDERRK